MQASKNEAVLSGLNCEAVQGRLDDSVHTAHSLLALRKLFLRVENLLTFLTDTLYCHCAADHRISGCFAVGPLNWNWNFPCVAGAMID